MLDSSRDFKVVPIVLQIKRTQFAVINFNLSQSFTSNMMENDLKDPCNSRS